MYYFQLSVDLETARGFLPFLYLLLRITSQEQATLYQQEQKEGKQYPMTHSFPNEPISCLVGFLKCCPLHLAPQMKLHQSGIATFGLWLRRSLLQSHPSSESKKGIRASSYLPPQFWKIPQGLRTPEFPVQRAKPVSVAI